VRLQGRHLARKVADLDDASEKNVAMENKLVPIRALLGELYLAAGMGKEAFAEFEASHKVVPNRFRTLAGAAKAARESGSVEAAKRYYGAPTALMVGSDGIDPKSPRRGRIQRKTKGQSRIAPIPRRSRMRISPRIFLLAIGLAASLLTGAASAGVLVEFPNVSEQPPARLFGYLARPGSGVSAVLGGHSEGAGPYAAVVVLHGCAGFPATPRRLPIGWSRGDMWP
jgi:hypothetical protein